MSVSKVIDILIGCILLLVTSVSAQTSSGNNYNKLTEVLPPAPNASSLGKYGGINVGLNTGTASFSIPLFTYTTANIELPVSLSYSSNGIKTDEIASRTGTSWNLQAGGVITRTVYGGSDEKVSCLTPPSTYPVRNNALFAFLTSLADDPDRQRFDAEPDVFSFTFGKYSGRFVLDADENVVQLAHSALKVEKVYDETSVLRWKITDPDGIQYYFGSDSARDISVKSSIGQHCGKSVPDGAVTAWYLSAIVHPNRDTVYFDYFRIRMLYTAGISQTMYADAGVRQVCEGTNQGCGLIPNTTCLSDISATAAVLKTIRSTDGTTVKFSYIDRKDVTDKLLSSVEVIPAGASSAIRTFRLSYVYARAVSYLNTWQSDSSFCFRPFLSGLKEYGTEISDSKEHSFSYYKMDSMPPRLTFAQDHFGYFNGRNNTTLIPRPVTLSQQQKFPEATADRGIDPKFAGNGLLCKIVYPTGGFDTIIYGGNKVCGTYEVMPEPVSYRIGGAGAGRFNTVRKTSPELLVQTGQEIALNVYCTFDGDAGYEYDDRHHIANISVLDLTTGSNLYTVTLWPGQRAQEILTLTAGRTYRVEVLSHGAAVSCLAGFSFLPGVKTVKEGNLDAGGMRVEKVVTRDPIGGTQLVKRYLYDQESDAGRSSGGRIFQSVYSRYLDMQQPCSGVFPGCTFTSCFYYTMHSGSVNNIYAYGHSPVSYTYVVESEGENFENGGTAHTYTLAADMPGFITMGEVVPGAPFTSRAWRNGLETMTHVFRIERGMRKSVQKIIYHYKEDSRVNQEIKAYLVNSRRRNVCTRNNVEFEDFAGFDLITYSHYSKWQYIDTTRMLTYSSEGDSYVEAVTAYTYGNPVHAQPTIIAKRTSNGSWKSVRQLYPPDLSYTGTAEVARLAMIRMNMVSPVLEQTETLGSKQTLRLWNRYAIFPNGLVLPQSRQLQVGNGRIEDGVVFYSYSPKGKILEQSQAADVREVLLWGYNSRYPVAHIANAVYDTVRRYIDQRLLDKPSGEAALRSHLQSLQQQLKGAFMTYHTYKDEIGMTSQTDVAGRTTYYNYDSHGRLKLVRDNEGRIRSMFDYRYQHPVTQ
ncbi:hypothetical protein [Chitinophaga rhizophila]|uniref:YD repeat-containing protein n=1 Tax=Chitinophaga rhizophila TaxID=2866212 RepID=A0ABS7GMA5_9BACT|nr:hypothetical protein [Chitinophaga rhizophila]MBW8687932.1 hypothetical protein [Chitinophaga rhizophila]